MKMQRAFKSTVVWLILNKRTEEALELLSGNYKISVPKLKIGLPKGHHKTAYGCYTNKSETISLLDNSLLDNPFVVLHEFYHHLRSRSVDKQHKGTEKNADKFAVDFIQEYEAAVKDVQSSKWNC
jgi:hypothetical protein